MTEITKTTVTERDKDGKVTRQTETVVEKRTIADYQPQPYQTYPWTVTSGYSQPYATIKTTTDGGLYGK
jgi:hypothetical protein